ncbi:MAG TPA: SpoIIE family protein phosphatase [Anaerolineae bacterium]|nr:SpoIIE family protein phosphatase [Anaerolineae bacterium]
MAGAKKDQQKRINEPPRTIDGSLYESDKENDTSAIEIYILINAISDPVVIIDAHGKIQLLNHAAISAYGFDPTGKSVSELAKRVRLRYPNGREVQPDEIPAIRALRGERVLAERFMFTNALGQERYIEASPSPLVSDGKVTGAIIVWHDVTERTQAVDNLRESNRRIELLLQSTDEGIYGVDIDERCTFVNRAASEMTGYRPEEMLDKNVHKLIHHSYSDGSPYPEKECPIYQAYRTGLSIRDDTEIFWRKDGSSFPVEYSSYPIVENGDIKGAVVAFTDITARKQAEKLSDALNAINASITSTLDFDEIMQRVVVEAMKAIACESAAITLYETGSWVIRYAYGFPQEVIGTSFTSEEAPHALLAARTRSPVVINDAFSDPRINPEVQKRFNVRSVTVIPLVVREEVVGALFFNYHSTFHVFTDAQIDFANKLSAGISLALENARLYAIERNISDTLQGALLTIPEKIEGIKFGHLYRSATEAARVGGDFYDLFELGYDKVGIIIGDVSGKGLKASALTSLVKNTIRAYALEGYTPAQVVAKTNELVVGASSPFLFITVFFGILDTEKGQLMYCSAGHTRAIVKRKTHKVELLATSSPMVGAFAGLSYVDDQAGVERGDTLILYTDGVIEARYYGELFGEDRLVALVKELKSKGPQEMPQAIFNEVLVRTGGRLSDDVAILAISLGGD